MKYSLLDENFNNLVKANTSIVAPSILPLICCQSLPSTASIKACKGLAEPFSKAFTLSLAKTAKSIMPSFIIPVTVKVSFKRSGTLFLATSFVLRTLLIFSPLY